MGIPTSVSKVNDPLLKAKRWDLSWEEHSKGWLSKPSPVSRADVNLAVLSPRFCIAEQHGLQQPKFRVIDDLSRFHVNSTADTTDTYCPENLDTLVTQARTLANLGRTDLKAWSVGFPNAYKKLVYATIPGPPPPCDLRARAITNHSRPGFRPSRLAAVEHQRTGEGLSHSSSFLR